MITISNTDVVGWEHAIRGMRNPLESWDKSDSEFGVLYNGDPSLVEVKNDTIWFNYIGPNDQNLMKRLRKAGTDHRKFMRMIVVYCDILAPLYWWKEFDTYKVGTVANSCSTMHCIHKKEFTLEDFSCDYLSTSETDRVREDDTVQHNNAPYKALELIVCQLNNLRNGYNVANERLKNDLSDATRKHILAKRKYYWYGMIQLLPSSYNQKRTVMLNYEVLANMYKSRKDHKLDEWHEFCAWIRDDLPYSELITGEELNLEYAEQQSVTFADQQTLAFGA